MTGISTAFSDFNGIWFRSWLGWGFVCAASIGAIDGNWLCAGIWLAVATAIACVGQRGLRWAAMRFDGGQFPRLDESAVRFQCRMLLQDAQRRMSPGDAIALLVIVPSVVGVFLGGGIGVLEPLAGGRGTVLASGLRWALWGPPLVCLMMTIAMLVGRVRQRPVPNLVPLRHLLDDACYLAEQRGDAALSRGHLLLAALGQLQTLANLDSNFNPPAARAAGDALQAEMPADHPDERGHAMETVQLAIKLALANRAAVVDLHYLLIALLETWPRTTERLLGTAGVDHAAITGSAVNGTALH